MFDLVYVKPKPTNEKKLTSKKCFQVGGYREINYFL